MKRNATEINVWLMRKGMNQSQIAREIGVHHSLVNSTIRGRRNCRRVLRKLLALGIPQSLLALPRDMREAA